MQDGLAELHTHLGGSVSSDILWTLAHEQGIALPVKDYWDFDRLVTVSDPRGVPNLDALDAIYHYTELIQSSPAADEEAVRDVFRLFVENGVRFTIATDGPEMMRTHLRDELDLLLRIGALTQEELDEANLRGHEASFVRGGFRAARV